MHTPPPPQAVAAALAANDKLFLSALVAKRQLQRHIPIHCLLPEETWMKLKILRPLKTSDPLQPMKISNRIIVEKSRKSDVTSQECGSQMDFQVKECIETWVWCVAQGHLHSGGTRGTWTLSGLVVRRTCQTFRMNGPSAFSHDSLLTPNARSLGLWLIYTWCRDRWLGQSKSWGPGTPEDHWTSGLSCVLFLQHGAWFSLALSDGSHTDVCSPHTWVSLI